MAAKKPAKSKPARGKKRPVTTALNGARTVGPAPRKRASAATATRPRKAAASRLGAVAKTMGDTARSVGDSLASGGAAIAGAPRKILGFARDHMPSMPQLPGLLGKRSSRRS